MVTIVYNKTHKNFSEIPLGEFFMISNNIYFKYSCDQAFCISPGRHIYTFNSDDKVLPVDTEIRIK